MKARYIKSFLLKPLAASNKVFAALIIMVCTFVAQTALAQQKPLTPVETNKQRVEDTINQTSQKWKAETAIAEPVTKEPESTNLQQPKWFEPVFPQQQTVQPPQQQEPQEQQQQAPESSQQQKKQGPRNIYQPGGTRTVPADKYNIYQ